MGLLKNFVLPPYRWGGSGWGSKKNTTRKQRWRFYAHFRLPDLDTSYAKKLIKILC